MKHPVVNTSIVLDQINLYKEESITIFISDTLRSKGYDNATQIEIRKKLDGEIEIFVNDQVTILSFDKWYKIE